MRRLLPCLSLALVANGPPSHFAQPAEGSAAQVLAEAERSQLASARTATQAMTSAAVTPDEKRLAADDRAAVEQAAVAVQRRAMLRLALAQAGRAGSASTLRATLQLRMLNAETDLQRAYGRIADAALAAAIAPAMRQRHDQARTAIATIL